MNERKVKTMLTTNKIWQQFKILAAQHDVKLGEMLEILITNYKT